MDGKLDRMSFDLDFGHYLMKYYPMKESNIVAIADCFNYYLAEEGFDKTDGLPDMEHKKLIRKQFYEFKSAMHDGLL
ncbi:MAG: hypothetical protein LBU83_13770 [Bacteroidales bacterium]|nr:hypothetical protein [Bacteroidales bacterium]